MWAGSCHEGCWGGGKEWCALTGREETGRVLQNRPAKERIYFSTSLGSGWICGTSLEWRVCGNMEGVIDGPGDASCNGKCG